MSVDHPRRQLLRRAALTLAAIPVLVHSRTTLAAQNATVRAQLRYQDTPDHERTCTQCLEFLPGKSERDRGRCKVIPGDDEISPDGYCTAWNTL